MKRRPACVAAALTFALTSHVGAAPSVEGPSTGPNPSACARFLPSPTAEGRAVFRDLPVLSPGNRSRGMGGLLSLDIRAEGPSTGRFAGGVAIGELNVSDVAGYVVTPAAGTHVRAIDTTRGQVAEMPPACLAAPAFAYGGMVWSFAQGDTLAVKLDSALDFRRGEVTPPSAGGVSCLGANLHVHGLMVSPYKRRLGDGGGTVYGDYVFDFAAPSGADPGDPCAPDARDRARMDMAPAGMVAMHAADGGEMRIQDHLAGAPGQSLRGIDAVPSGLFWYHPHTHGYAGLLTAGAASGVITVGDLADYACVAGSNGTCAAGEAPRVRYLLLKDAELAPQARGWRLEPDRDWSLEDACASGIGGRAAAQRDGQCVDWRGHRWIFTVNGVRDPLIADGRPGGTEVWRIVNGSSNVTYRLTLRPLKTDDADQALPLSVLTVEGAAPAARGWATPGTTRALLLMPGARAEIAVAPPPQGGSYGLQQEGFASGGDVWPSVRLAEVRFAPGASRDQPLSLHGPVASTPTPSQAYVENGAAPGCGFGPQDVRHIYFVQRPSFADDRRKTGLYGLLAAVEHPAGVLSTTDADGRPTPLNAESWRTLLKRDPLAPAAMHNPYGAVCTYLGHTETWVIENDTDEDHNFHIHQAEFQLALDHIANPAFFSTPPDATRDPVLAASDRAVAAADGRGREAEEAVLYHDTIPVPRGVGLGGRGCDGSPMNAQCRPGRVTVRIAFTRDEQVGTFVYHCHILQHEDNGMMAMVRVLCPPGDAACAARHPIE